MKEMNENSVTERKLQWTNVHLFPVCRLLNFPHGDSDSAGLRQGSKLCKAHVLRSDYNADFQGQTIKPELKRHGLPTRALLGEKLAYSKNRRYGYR